MNENYVSLSVGELIVEMLVGDDLEFSVPSTLFLTIKKAVLNVVVKITVLPTFQFTFLRKKISLLNRKSEVNKSRLDGSFVKW